MEIVRGAPGLEQWRRLAALYDPSAAGKESGRQQANLVSAESYQNRRPLTHTIQAWENLEQRHRERTGDQLPRDMRLAILLSMCPTDLEKEMTAQQHLFLDYAQMKARIVTVINGRTRGLAPMMMGNLSDEDGNHHASIDESMESEDGELYRLEIRNGKKVVTNSRHEPSKGKGGGKGKIDRECFRCGRTGHTLSACPSSVCTSPMVNIGSGASRGGDPVRPPEGATRRRDCLERKSTKAEGWYDGTWNDGCLKAPDYWSSSSSSLPAAYSWMWPWEHHSPWSNQWNSPVDTQWNSPVDTTSSDPRQCGDGRGEVIPSFDGADLQTVREAGASLCVQYTSGRREKSW